MTVKPWITVDGKLDYILTIKCECPDCHSLAFVNAEEVEFSDYNFCPVCGKRRMEDDEREPA